MTVYLSLNTNVDSGRLSLKCTLALKIVLLKDPT